MAIEPVTVKQAIEMAREDIDNIKKLRHQGRRYTEALQFELYFTHYMFTPKQKIKYWTDNALWASLEVFVDAVLNHFENES